MDEQRKLLRVEGLTQQSSMVSMLCISERNTSNVDNAYLQAGREALRAYKGQPGLVLPFTKAADT
jgi:hypothetical protein